MIPRSLSISGFLSYKEVVEIDFTQLHVACISGPNGAGKSAMLDAITWALFGEARQNDETVINSSVQPRMAEVIFDFEYEGELYRVIRRRESGKSSAVDFSIRERENERWRVLTCKRVSETNALIRDTLRMDYQTFINASFFLQGKADQFTNQNASERKQVLSNILDLDVWETYKERTVERRKQKTNELNLIEKYLEDAETELGNERSYREKLAELETQLTDVEKKREAYQQRWQNAKSIETRLTAQQENVKKLAQRSDSETHQINESQTRLTSRQNEIRLIGEKIANEDEIELDHQTLIKVRNAVAEMSAQSEAFHKLESESVAIQIEIRNQETRLNEKINLLSNEQDTLDKKRSVANEIESQLNQKNSQISELHTKTSDRIALAEQINALTDREAEKNADNKQLRKRMDELEQKITQLQSAAGSLCPTCGREMDMAHCLQHCAELKKEGTMLGDLFRVNKSILLQLQQEKITLNEKATASLLLEKRIQLLEKESAALNARLATFYEEISRWENNSSPQLAKALQIRNSVDFCAKEKNELLRIQKDLTDLNYDPTAYEYQRGEEKRLTPSDQRWQELQKAKAALAPLERERADLQKTLTDLLENHQNTMEELEKQQALMAELAEALPDLRILQAELNTAQAEENRLRMLKGGAEQNVHALIALKEKTEKYRAEQNQLNHDIAKLKKLETAFSKNGIPALLIEQALPEIENQSNEILGLLTDDRMSLRFSTQKDYKDKNRTTMKETLDILISDENGTRAYELFSGGEAFRVNFAIRLALSRLLTKRAGSRLQMLVIDEGFGSQDTDGRQRLIEAISSVQDDFATILVITHMEELKDAFPSRIEVEKTVDGTKVSVIQ